MDESESSDESDDDEDYDINDADKSTQINYVVGDVTLPLNTGENDAVIIHCVGENNLVLLVC